MQRADSLEKTPMLGKIEGRRRRRRQRMRWLDGITTQWTCVWASSGSWWWTGRPGVLQSMLSQRVGHDWMTKQQQQLGPAALDTGNCSLWIAFGVLLLCHGHPHITRKLSDFLPAYLLYWFSPPRSNAGFHVSGCRVLTILQTKF